MKGGAWTTLDTCHILAALISGKYKELDNDVSRYRAQKRRSVENTGFGEVREGGLDKFIQKWSGFTRRNCEDYSRSTTATHADTAEGIFVLMQIQLSGFGRQPKCAQPEAGDENILRYWLGDVWKGDWKNLYKFWQSRPKILYDNSLAENIISEPAFMT